MEVEDADQQQQTSTTTTGGAASAAVPEVRFEIKRWAAVALWAWDIQVDNCAICRNHIMEVSAGEGR
jgi:RING-box protein 1